MSVPLEYTGNIDQPAFLAARARTVGQSRGCCSTVNPTSRMFWASTRDAVWLIEPATSRTITGSPLYPEALSSAFAAARSTLATLAPASVVSGVPHIQNDGHALLRYCSGTPIAVKAAPWS